MKILAIGDIVGVRAIEHLKQNLWGIRRKLGIDFVVANGENATEIHGLSASDAQKILDSLMNFNSRLSLTILCHLMYP